MLSDPATTICFPIDIAFAAELELKRAFYELFLKLY